MNKNKSTENLIGTNSYAFSKDSNDLLEKIAELKSFFVINGINYNNFNLEKQAYPNNDHYMAVPGQHNIDKWMETVRNIYFKEKQGESRNNIIKEVTAGWKPTETYDFLNWLKFYEESSHLKYKFASWYENGSPGYFLHIGDNQKSSDDSVTYDVASAKDATVSELSASQKKSIISKQKNKIISRLDSAEKLLRSEEGQLFAGQELESLMETIYGLKKKIQLLNKVSTSVKLYEDLIIREANVLMKKGFSDAAEMLYVLADDKKTETPPADKAAAPPAETSPADKAAAPPAEPPPADTAAAPAAETPPADTAITPAPPAPPAEGSGSAGGLPAAVPAQPNSPEAPQNENSPVDKKHPAVAKFLANTQTGGISSIEDMKDNNDSSDSLVVYDDESDLLSQAQAAPGQPPPPPQIVESPEEPLEVVEEPQEVNIVKSNNKEIKNPVSEFDNKVNDAFSTLRIEDVVLKLEDLAKIFKTREVPRQLAIVDMMLDSLGLASYFPSLSEATNKALESNNYISTRIEDIISKLRGALKTRDIDLRGDTTPAVVTNPELDSIKQSLEQSDKKDKLRKDLRKQQQEEELGLDQIKETPEIEIDEEPPIPQPITPTPAQTTPPAPIAATPAPVSPIK